MISLSYGAGVQTFGILVGIEQGIIQRPDYIIFADTENEEIATYQHMGEVAIPLIRRLHIPFRVIHHGNLYLDSLNSGHTPRPPICTKTYKIRPIEKFLKRVYPGQHYIMVGISTDEAHRAESKSESKNIEKIFPLIELGLSRSQVIDLILAAGYPVPPKSGCFFCPWKSKEFLRMKQDNPDKFKACLNLETYTGHKLPRYGSSLATIDQQMFFDFEGDNCSSGFCGI